MHVGSPRTNASIADQAERLDWMSELFLLLGDLLKTSSCLPLYSNYDAFPNRRTWSDLNTQPVKIDLNKKSLPRQKTIQNFNIDAQGFRKTKNENPPTWEIGVTS